jgi:beta-glucanase (GH16 family)
MLGNDIGTAGWPACGEIDIMENIGREPSAVHGTLHGPGYSGAGGLGAAYNLPAGQRFADEYHLYAVEWEPEAIRWKVDGRLHRTWTPADLPAGKKWVFDHPFFLLLNVAVGGYWPGNPDATTAFPQQMHVDYVRVYERSQ